MTTIRRLALVVALALAPVVAACGGDDDGEPTQRTFDESGMDQYGCSAHEEYDPGSGLCEPGPCLAAAQERQDEAGARQDEIALDDVDAYNEAVEDYNQAIEDGENCEAEAREELEGEG